MQKASQLAQLSAHECVSHTLLRDNKHVTLSKTAACRQSQLTNTVALFYPYRLLPALPADQQRRAAPLPQPPLQLQQQLLPA